VVDVYVRAHGPAELLKGGSSPEFHPPYDPLHQVAASRATSTPETWNAPP
jgi:hypothetical protein